MSVNLPQAFTERMQALLGNDFEAYLQSFDSPRVAGLRVNTSKITPQEFATIAPFEVIPIPWTTDGFYVSVDVRPAKHPLYHAGLYYLQEPSAMAPAQVLAPKPGDRVLDVCAAPGGKTLQLANAVGDFGVVVSNDISATRLQAVVRNVELFGLKNVIITASELKTFGSKHENFYDSVLLDAPCSGEGMFRKDTAMLNHWKPESPHEYSAIQKSLIADVDYVLKEGGHLVYSTCTFSPEENEDVIAHGLGLNPDWHVVPIKRDKFAPGIVREGNQALMGTARLYPFNLEGEGHFVAHLQKGGSGQESGDREAQREAQSETGTEMQVQAHEHQGKSQGAKSAVANLEAAYPKELAEFMAAVLNPPGPDDFRSKGALRLHGDKLLIDPVAVPDLQGIRVIRRGWYLGDMVKGRFEPAQSFAMGLKKHQIKNHITFDLDDTNAVRYLKCESLPTELPNGWYVVCLGEFPLGWAKVAGGQFKNKYPAAWRMQ